MIERRDVSRFRIVVGIFLCLCIRLVIKISVDYYIGTLKKTNFTLSINFKRRFISILLTAVVYAIIRLLSVIPKRAYMVFVVDWLYFLSF